MAMFDIGKRGSSSDQSHEDDFMRELDTPVSPVASESTGSGVRRREAAVIGPSIHIEGTLRGEEDLIIDGHVSGTVQLHENSLTIGSHGQVKADIYAHTIFVEGTVEGDLFGSERVAIKKTADIRGNITSPRVSLEDGAKFKGAIEMDKQAVEAAMGPRKSKPAGSAGASSSSSVPAPSAPTSSSAASAPSTAQPASSAKPAAATGSSSGTPSSTGKTTASGGSGSGSGAG
ncbi:MAG: polymer-forming cytoskeletal protein [Aquisalimonadaceae bacterium]